MKVVNPNNTNHIIKLISRVYPVDALDLLLYNESTQIETSVTNTYIVQNGFLNLTFDFTFVEGDRFQIKILELTNVIYRGKLIATSEDTQTYLNDNNEYYYE